MVEVDTTRRDWKPLRGLCRPSPIGPGQAVRERCRSGIEPPRLMSGVARLPRAPIAGSYSLPVGSKAASGIVRFGGDTRMPYAETKVTKLYRGLTNEPRQCRRRWRVWSWPLVERCTTSVNSTDARSQSVAMPPHRSGLQTASNSSRGPEYPCSQCAGRYEACWYEVPQPLIIDLESHYQVLSRRCCVFLDRQVASRYDTPSSAIGNCVRSARLRLLGRDTAIR